MRAAICGDEELTAVAEALGLEIVRDRPEIVLVDLRDTRSETALEAAAHPREIPRVVIADARGRAIARALGWADDAIASSADPAILGPLLRAAVPLPLRGATRVIAVTSTRGGVGRTLLVTNLARRLTKHVPTLVLDLTGSGMSGWWLGTAPRSWEELESLAGELTAEHLAFVVDRTACGVSVLGGAATMPSPTLALAAVRAALGVAALVLIDAPPLADERTRAIESLVDRLLVVGYDDDASRAAEERAVIPSGAWCVASQSRGVVADARETFHVLPRDEAAIGAAMANREGVGGSLGNAYDALARILLEDTAR